MYIEDGNFSLWCDFIERDFLDKGLKELIEKKIVNGATSNPSIFKNAFLNSPAYKSDIQSLKNKKPKEIYEALAIKDIQKSADLLLHLYEKGDDGFISIEVDPSLCDDSEATVLEGKRLFKAINRPNVMIKVPATDAGYKAMKELMSEGINVNATLIFSPAQAQRCLDAFEEAKNDTAFGVISIFVSRFDRKMDSIFEEKAIEKAKLGIYNATKIYHDIQKRALKNVKALFASTGVKGDDLPKAYYVTELLYENSINTAPLDTIDAFVKTGIKEIKRPVDEKLIEDFFNELKRKDINIKEIYNSLVDEGLEAFKIAFKEILKELEKG